MPDTFILCDWGNSRGRFYLSDGQTIIHQSSGLGASKTDNCPDVFDEITREWSADRAILTGAVTSNIGWQTTQYVSAPARLEDFPALVETTQHRGRTLHFLPGLSVSTNPLGLFDTVRGEDMIALGYAAQNPEFKGWLVLPGTHVKWMRVERGAITDIFTGLTGEMLDVLKNHSILALGGVLSDGISPAFEHGLTSMTTLPRPALTQILASTRSLQLGGTLTPQASADYLSGLLIGEDVAGAKALIGTQSITVLGQGPTAQRYTHALEKFGFEPRLESSEQALLYGLHHIAQLIEA